MADHPFFVGGTEAYDSQIIESTGGNVIAREGGDGTACFAVHDQELGIAIYAPAANKAAKAAKHAAAIRLLQLLGALPDPLPAALQDSLNHAQTNTRDEFVGELRVRG